jgi:protein-arginine kinase activator protein McsA
MQREMESAIAGELYERAAELRDAINLLKTQKPARSSRGSRE